MKTLAIWKAIFGSFLLAGLLLAISSGLLAVTKRSLDLYLHDRYLLVLPIRLLLISVLFFIAAFAVWKGRLSH